MYVEDQDEDVEEEEEFHEVEEEKHKTSQESVSASGEHSQKNSPVHRDQLTSLPADNEDQSERSEHHVSTDTQSTEAKDSEDVAERTCVTDDQAVKEVDKEELLKDGIPSEILQPTAEPNEVVEDSKNAKTLEATEAQHEPSETKNEGSIARQPDIAKKSDEAKATDQVSAPKSGIDWANIMMHSATNGGQPSEENSFSDKVDSNNPVSHPIANADDTIDGIIQETGALKISDESVLGSPTKAHVETDPISSVSSGAEITIDADVAKSPSGDNNEALVVDQKDGSGEADECQDKVDETEKKELDLDEDVKNPQYIPKKGVFYEHDDRSHDTDEKKSSPNTSNKEDESVEVKDPSANKKSGVERPTDNRRGNRRQRTDADRWNHDLFRNEKQKPKSKSELINAYGYDIRQERSARGNTENRASRAINTSSSINDRAIGGQDVQRSRQPKEARGPRQIQPSASSGSRERKPRRQNSKTNRGESSQVTPNRRDAPAAPKPAKIDNTRDLRETLNEKHAAQAAESAVTRRDRDVSGSNRNTRNDSRGRRRTSRDRPNVDDARLPPPNSVMPPITTWSSEDMMIAEAFGKKSPPQVEVDENLASNTSITKNVNRERPIDGWDQGPPMNKLTYQDRPNRNQEEIRQQQHYNSRNRYQDRGDENHRTTQFTPRNQYHERSNQQHEWHRTGNFSPYAKSNDYVVKTQTFENSRLSQANQNRTNNNRDLRDVINERRGNGQQNFQNKIQHNIDHHANQRSHVLGHYHHQYPSAQHYMHPHHQQIVQGQSHMSQQQPHQQLTLTQSQLQQHQRSQQQSPHQIQSSANQTQQPQQHNSQAQHSRQPPTTQSGQPANIQPRHNLALNNVADPSSDSMRLNAASNNDSLNSRPIVKTETYTSAGPSGHQQHTQALSQHSQNHRSMGEHLTQPTGVTSSSHIVPSHLGTAATQPQYYQPSNSSRDPSSAALASGYHGYIPSGHPVMDPSRYHMTSQIPDHGYITPGQTSDVAASSILHQQSLYTDTSGAGAMASTAYLTQAGSSLSPTTNIPVTGTGSQPLPPVSYIQHSQYPPPPYSNPYSQPQMNQPPPQSGHAYPYWTYI